MENEESKNKALLKGPFTFKEVIIVTAIVIVAFYLVKLIFKVSMFFLIRFIIPVLLLVWLVSVFRETREENARKRQS